MAMGRRKRKLADRILALFLEEPAKERYGYEVCRETEAHAGRVYTILRRLEDEGILDSRWGHAPTPDMRPRRYYRLTDDGRRVRLEQWRPRHPDFRRLVPRLSPT